MISPNDHPQGMADKNNNWDTSPEDCLTIHVTLEGGFPAGRMSRFNLILIFRLSLLILPLRICLGICSDKETHWL